MEEKHLLQATGIDPDDWEKTPLGVRKIMVQLSSYVEQLEQQLKELQGSYQQLEEKVNRNSSNSHSPPSSDLGKAQQNPKKRKGGKKRGGQPGHEGQSRKLYPVEECSLVTNHYPEICSCCGEKLTGIDPNPYRHQIVEIPPIQLHIEEHRLHQLSCDHCGEKTRASLPESVVESGYGGRVVAIVALMSGMYRHSHRMVVSAMSDYFGVELSTGTVNRLRTDTTPTIGWMLLEDNCVGRILCESLPRFQNAVVSLVNSEEICSLKEKNYSASGIGLETVP